MDRKLEILNLKELDFEKMDGLLPAIIQNYVSGKVLMLGYMNSKAIERSLNDQVVTFYSRSKGRLWKKGETSGNILNVKKVYTDCDKDAVLILVEPEGPTCHLGSESCFGDVSPMVSALTDLDRTIKQKIENPIENSYTSQLIQAGAMRIAQKVGEEGVEVALAAIGQSDKELLSESADLFYHLLVCLRSKNLGIKDLAEELMKRFK